MEADSSRYRPTFGYDPASHEGKAAVESRRDARLIRAASMEMVPDPQNGSSKAATGPSRRPSTVRLPGSHATELWPRQAVAAFVQQFPGRVHADGAFVIDSRTMI